MPATRFAQSRNCQALANTLSQIERSGNFASLGDINDQTRQAQDAVTQAESRYVRDGCNAAAKAGQPLNAQCPGRSPLGPVGALRPQENLESGRYRQCRRPAARGDPAGNGALQLQQPVGGLGAAAASRYLRPALRIV